MGRQERPLNPDDGPVQGFAFALRCLREAAGQPGYRELAKRANYSVTALAEAAGGAVLPSLPVALAYAEACGGDRRIWTAHWKAAATAATAATTTATTTATATTAEGAGPAAHEGTSTAAERAGLTAEVSPGHGHPTPIGQEPVPGRAPVAVTLVALTALVTALIVFEVMRRRWNDGGAERRIVPLLKP